MIDPGSSSGLNIQMIHIITHTHMLLLQQMPLLFIHFLNQGLALLAADLQVELERQRSSDDVAREGLGVGPLGLSVGSDVGLHRERPQQGAAGDEELGFRDLDAGTHAAAAAEAVVANQTRVHAQRLLVRRVLRLEPTGRVVGFAVGVEDGVAGDGEVNGVHDGALGDVVAVVFVVFLHEARNAERDRWAPSEALLDAGAEDREARRVGQLDDALRSDDGVNLGTAFLLPLRVEHHGEEEAVKRASDGEDGHRAQHSHGVGGFVFVESKILSIALLDRRLPAFKVRSRIRDVGGTVGHLALDLVQESRPEAFLSLSSLSAWDLGRVEPLRQISQERKKVGDRSTGRGRNLGDEFSRVLTVSRCGMGRAVAQPCGDASAKPIGLIVVVQWVSDQVEEESLSLQRDIAVVLIIKRGG